MLKLKIRRVGNSAGIIFPLEILKRHNFQIGDDLVAEDSADAITLKAAKVRKKYSLRDLIAEAKQNPTPIDHEFLSIEDNGEEKIW